jgi:hypothetical protein
MKREKGGGGAEEQGNRPLQQTICLHIHERTKYLVLIAGWASGGVRFVYTVLLRCTLRRDT